MIDLETLPSGYGKELHPMISCVSNMELEEIKSQNVRQPQGKIFTPMLDVKVLIWIGKKTSGDILEIGCNEGTTTASLCDAFPNRKVYGIDCKQPVRENPHQSGEVPGEIGKFAVRKRNAVIVDSDFEVCDLSQLQSVGFAFVDSDHTYEGVKKSTERALELPLLTAIAWHDFSVYDYEHQNPWIGVGRYLRTELQERMTIRSIPGTTIAFAML